MQAIITRESVTGLSDVQLREWQRYRGWTIKILEELEHSGGKTTREISTGTGCRCATSKDILRRMLKVDLVERVERWGWRITVTGVFLLSINYGYTSATQQLHNSDTTATQEKEEPAPSCFHAKSCHIKKICDDKRYTSKTMMVCLDCVWNNPRAIHFPTLPLEMKAGGL